MAPDEAAQSLINLLQVMSLEAVRPELDMLNYWWSSCIMGKVPGFDEE